MTFLVETLFIFSLFYRVLTEKKDNIILFRHRWCADYFLALLTWLLATKTHADASSATSVPWIFNSSCRVQVCSPRSVMW